MADDHGADQDRVLKTWPVLHRAAGKGSLGPMAARSAALMHGFRGFMVPARFARYGVPFTGLFTQFCPFPGEKVFDVSNPECSFDLPFCVGVAIMFFQGIA